MTPSTTNRADRTRERAHSLYWESDQTVDQLASQLGITRRAVYAAVRPVSAGSPCPQCGQLLVFTNRSARAARSASCPSCLATLTLDATVPAEAGTAPPFATATAPAAVPPLTESGPAVHEVPPPGKRWEQLKEDLAAVPPDRAAKIGGAAALGVAIGAAAVKVIKKRR